MNSALYKYILLLLCIAMNLDCVTVAWSSKCEKKNETGQALGRLISALTHHKSILLGLVYNHRLTRFLPNQCTLYISNNRVNGCTYVVRVGIRQFINNQPTIRGIYLRRDSSF